MYMYHIAELKKNCLKTMKCDLWELVFSKGLFHMDNTDQEK